MLSEGVGYSWGFIVVAMYGGMTHTLTMIAPSWDTELGRSLGLIQRQQDGSPPLSRST